ncbi:hypothetical protein KAU11_01010 [Candidatus Babeliales bacterium]|nr:hypothetical protein [Candidatus Babeliales bacterium]
MKNYKLLLLMGVSLLGASAKASWFPGIEKKDYGLDFGNKAQYIYPAILASIVGAGAWRVTTKLVENTARHKAFLEVKRRLIKKALGAGKPAPKIREKELTPEMEELVEEEMQRNFSSYTLKRALIVGSIIAGVTGLLSWRFAHVRTDEYNKSEATSGDNEFQNLHADVISKAKARRSGLMLFNNADSEYDDGSDDLIPDEESWLQIASVSDGGTLGLMKKINALEDKLQRPAERDVKIGNAKTKMKFRISDSGVRAVTGAKELLMATGTLKRRLARTKAYTEDCRKAGEDAMKIARSVRTVERSANFLMRLKSFWDMF